MYGSGYLLELVVAVMLAVAVIGGVTFVATDYYDARRERPDALPRAVARMARRR